MIYKTIKLNIDYKGKKLKNGGHQANMCTYLLDNFPEVDMERNRPTVIICPGGGYKFVSCREAEPIAIKLNSFGYHAIVLHYSVTPATFPTSLVELATAVETVRKNADEWNVDTNKIIVAGFSAGGHLACSLGVFWDNPILTNLMDGCPEMWKPNGMILNYPVITSGKFAHKDSIVNLLGTNYNEKLERVSLENYVGHQTPPTFLWHTFSDNVVFTENSLLFANALRDNNVLFELHIFPKGIHGLALATEETCSKSNPDEIQDECKVWIDLANSWIKRL